jgi:hypothetical protein
MKSILKKVKNDSVVKDENRRAKFACLCIHHLITRVGIVINTKNNEGASLQFCGGIRFDHGVFYAKKY